MFIKFFLHFFYFFRFPRDLAPKDMFGSSDPFVTVAFLDQTKTTSVSNEIDFHFYTVANISTRLNS